MKVMKIMIAAILAVALIFGWVVALQEVLPDGIDYNKYTETADEWVAEGLYQRAIAKYEEVIIGEPTKEVYDKQLVAYSLRYKEDANIYDDYVDAFHRAIDTYPDCIEFYENLGRLYIDNENYSSAYKLLKGAIDSGVESETIIALKKESKYAYYIMGNSYYKLIPSSGTSYVAKTDGGWGSYNSGEGISYRYAYEYISRFSKDGTAVITSEKDSRIINGEGFVLGIFPEKVTSAKTFTENRVAVYDGEKYVYYDDFSKRVLGDFEDVSSFCDGKIAVKENGQWVILDEEKVKVSDTYDDIALNLSDGFITNGRMLALKNGFYAIYDEEYKKVGDFNAVDVDAPTEDGVFAFSDGNAWGFADLDGNVVLPCKYENARSFSNGLAAVCIDEKWGFIDLSGEVVIPCQFTDALYFDIEGFCPARTDIPPEPEIEEEAILEEDNTPAEEQVAAEEATSENDTIEGTDGEGAAEEPEIEEYKETWKFLRLNLGITED